MKANELMIGDWVYSTFCDKPCKVIGIEQYESEYANVKVTNVTGAKDINSIYFIPLTAEILEKNGFDIAILNNKEPEAYLRMGYLDDDGEMEDVAYDIIIDHHKTYWELTIINNDKG